ncbi:M28 family peptidase [Chitinophaga sp. 30R24]|uniref:M28 family peptidase n=1 Tax=Chitinophaga sp. 30R24 TaxID=3248838 RepID=UPI003B8F6B33
MKKITWLLPFFIIPMHSHAQRKEDRKTIGNLQLHIDYLNSDTLQAHNTGAPGEQLATAYLSAQMQQLGLTPKGDNGFLQPFTVKETREPAASSHMSLNDEALVVGKQFIPLPFSASKAAKGEATPGVNEPDNIWFINVAEMDTSNPQTMLEQYLYQTQAAEKAGATGVIFFNGQETTAQVTKWITQHTAATSIPAVWVSNDISKKLEADDAATFHINLEIAFHLTKRTGTNVIGYINNQAPKTIIIGAHYNYPEQETNAKPENNAGSIAALLELARLLSGSRLHNHNYLVIAFSGKEQGQYGSSWYATHSTINLSEVNYMINLDGIGQLPPGQPLQIGGDSTSSGWTDILHQTASKDLPVIYDSSHTSTADHTAFYQKNIPVLYFNTLTNKNNSINYEETLRMLKLVYNVIDKTNNKDKLAFSH